MTVATTVATETSEDDRTILANIAEQPYLVHLYFPGSYTPLRYAAGDICDTCWLEDRIVSGIGKDGCNHK